MCDSDNILTFVGQGGCTQDMSNKSPTDFFQFFITDEILHTIIQQTNLFADQFIESQDESQNTEIY